MSPTLTFSSPSIHLLLVDRLMVHTLIASYSRRHGTVSLSFVSTLVRRKIANRRFSWERGSANPRDFPFRVNLLQPFSDKVVGSGTATDANACRF